MMFLDTHPEVLEWQSEEIIIWYLDPTMGRRRRYFPDFLVKTRTGTTLIEVKPDHQTKPSQAKTTSKRYLKEQLEYARNMAKWQAAEAFAKQRGWEFKIMTQHHLGIKNGK